MSAIRSLKLKALGLAAAFALIGGASSAAPPKGAPGGVPVGNGGGSMKPSNGFQPAGSFKPTPQHGGAPKINPGLGVGKVGNGLPKIDPVFSNGPKGNVPKIDPGFGNGIKPGNGGPKIDPGKGNGPIGNGPKIDPGKGNGPFGKGMANKHWLQKPGNGMQKTIFCKTPCPKDYCHKYGVKCSYGYCYKGSHHDHWHCRRWSDVHGCWFFYDPCCLNWYYYCETDVCYYPVSYVPYKTFVCSAPTTTVVSTPIVTTPIVTTYYVPTYHYVTPTYYVAPVTYATTPVVASTTTTTVAANANLVAAGAPTPAGGPAPAGGGMTLPPLPGE